MRRLIFEVILQLSYTFAKGQGSMRSIAIGIVLLQLEFLAARGGMRIC